MHAPRLLIVLACVTLSSCRKDREPQARPQSSATPADAAAAAMVARDAAPASIEAMPPSALLGPLHQGAAAVTDGTGLGSSGARPQAASNQPVQDDAAFEAAVMRTMLRQYSEGSSGYSRSAYNFLGDHQLLYCSYFYSTGEGGQTVESNQVGTWKVTVGYTVPSVPGYTAGKIHITGSDFDVTMAAEMLDAKAGVDTGNASNTFSKGAFTRAKGGAVTNCSAIE